MKTEAVRRAPLEAGESMPSMAKNIVMNIMQKSWIPEPTSETKRRLLGGGRKTSPCTSFQPVSSMLSSTSSSMLYLAMSRLRVRMMIILQIKRTSAIREVYIKSNVLKFNSRDNAAQEEYHDDAVDDRKPMDLNV